MVLNEKTNIPYIVYPIISIVISVIIKFLDYAWGSGILSFFLIYYFLKLVHDFNSKKQRVISGLAFVIGYTIAFWNIFGEVFSSLVALIFVSLIFYLSILLSSIVIHKWNNFLVTLILPVMWLILFFCAMAIGLPSFLRLDFLLYELTLLIQAEGVVGSLVFGFVIVWIVSILRFGFYNKKLWSVLLAVILCFGLTIPGIINLFSDETFENTVRVAYSTGPYLGDFINCYNVSYNENEKSLEKTLKEAALNEASIMVYTEEAFCLEDIYEEQFLTTCSKLAKEYSISVLLGLEIMDTDNSHEGKSFNKITFIDDKGEIIDSYVKTKLIPLLESDCVKGDGIIPSHTLSINGQDVTISYIICYDSNFPLYVNDMDNNTDILLLPSWDWKEITKRHSMLCSMLATENDVSILKPTYDGMSVAITPDGKVFHQSSTDTSGFEQVHIVDIPY